MFANAEFISMAKTQGQLEAADWERLQVLFILGKLPYFALVWSLDQ